MSTESEPTAEPARPNRAAEWAERRAARRAQAPPPRPATARTPRTRRPSRKPSGGTGYRLGLLWRAVPSIAALVALRTDAPDLVPGVVAILGLVLAGDRLVRLRRLGVADGLLSLVGGLAVGAVLVGVLLGATSFGLSASSWVVALAALGLVGLVVAAALPRRPVATPALVPDAGDPEPTQGRGTRRTVLALLPWVGIAVAVAVVAVRLSASSPADDEVPVSLAFGLVDGTRVELVVSAAEPAGPFEIRTVAAGGANLTSYPLVTLDEAGEVTATVSLPRSGRYLVTLRVPGDREPLRTLVLDR